MRRRRWPSSALAAVMLVLTLLGLAGQAQNARGEDTPVASLPSGYWDRPLAKQGEAPQAWIEIERSLAPGACGECHMRQADEWRTSLHAKAFSPGLVGQLLTFDAAGTARCMDCHAPLAEQKQAFEQARAKGVGHLTGPGLHLVPGGPVVTDDEHFPVSMGRGPQVDDVGEVLN